MAYTWDKNLETGHETIDSQHKQLVATVNKLVEINRADDARNEAEIGEVLEFLIAYAVKHFGDEETLQEKYNYPDFNVHKTYHEDFKRQVGELSRRMAEEGATRTFIDELTRFVGDWLLTHIKGDDFRMAAYVQSKEAGR